MLVHPAPRHTARRWKAITCCTAIFQTWYEALPYWCILPLMHKVSHTLAIGLYLSSLDVCILPLMHKVSHTVYIVALAISNMCSSIIIYGLWACHATPPP